LATNSTSRAKQLAQYNDYDRQIAPVIRALSMRSYQPVKSGFYKEVAFAADGLREKHADELLGLIVPEGYDPSRPTGLIVFLHGGGSTSSADSAWYRLDPEQHSSHQMLTGTRMITVAPTALGKHESAYRWCLPRSGRTQPNTDEYLADVIAECKARFNIDSQRVFLLGHSMGGFGAFHHAQRQPDRFAAIIVSAGAWDCGYWPVIRGTPLWIVHSSRDAERGRHYTDFAFAAWTHTLLQRDHLDHRLEVHNGFHDISYGCEILTEFFQSAKDVRRDPYYPHITLASPVGWSWTYRRRVRHNRWLTLDDTTDGELTYDELVPHGSNSELQGWSLEHRRTTSYGSMIDAVNRGDNRFDIRTEHVAQFTVWLHPQMIDITQPVTIVLNGEVAFEGKVTPSLTTALESYERRGDWGLIYPMKIQLKVSH